jgi:DNA-directed RNA polymerase II subunit RPB1
MYKQENKGHTWSQEGGVKVRVGESRYETDGSNLREILAEPDIDHTRTFSNDVCEIGRVLGIEACRQALLNEIKTIISFESSYVNYRHLAMLVDTMTFRGYLTPVTRHGINRVESGPLMRASFEETCEIFMDAAVYAEVRAP